MVSAGPSSPRLFFSQSLPQSVSPPEFRRMERRQETESHEEAQKGTKMGGDDSRPPPVFPRRNRWAENFRLSPFSIRSLPSFFVPSRAFSWRFLSNPIVLSGSRHLSLLPKSHAMTATKRRKRAQKWIGMILGCLRSSRNETAGRPTSDCPHFQSGDSRFFLCPLVHFRGDSSRTQLS